MDKPTSRSDTPTKEQLLTDFVETSDVGLHWVGKDGTILWANPADYEPLGYSAHEYIGRNIAEFHADSDSIADILRRLKAGERLRDYEARLRCKDGSIRSVLINSSVLFDERGEFVHTRCFTFDITEQKQLEEAKEQFVNILGHDLRNPLSAITVGAQFLLKAGDLPEKHMRAAARIARSADRMARMIADLLDFARGRMGEGIPVERIVCDMAVVCRQVVEEIQVANGNRNISVDISGDARGDWDPDRVAQVISNLMANAIEHGADPITVFLHGEEDAVLLEVSNRGTPISDHLLPVIFQPFSRRDGGSPLGTGLGLGLFIASEIVRAHGATIAVRSTESEGTTFAVRWTRRDIFPSSTSRSGRRR
jgi:PAS domain S-box-containing protein